MASNEDLDLRTDIEDELEFEPMVNAAGIGVAVRDGVVTLTGHVESYAEKLAAERAASRVKGVRAVAEEIDVRLPADPRHDDDEIARRAANVLTWSVYLPKGGVRVKVEKGWVTVSGQVRWQYQRLAAQNAIQRLGGVTGVTNLITISPSVAAVDVRERIMQAYRRNAELESAGINIAVDGGTVTLSGRVKAWKERRAAEIAAEIAAWAVPGVTEVVDHLIVT